MSGLRHKWYIDFKQICRCLVCKTIWTKANRYASDCPGEKK